MSDMGFKRKFTCAKCGYSGIVGVPHFCKAVIIGHDIERTSPKGGKFLGTCVNCGAKGLSSVDALKPCPAKERRTLIDSIRGVGGKYEP